MLLVFHITISLLSCSQTNPVPSEFEEKLQKAMDNGVRVYQGKGIQASVIMPDGDIWNGVSGISHGTIPITEETRFAAGSIAKMFTALTILQLTEEEKIRLEDTLFDWLPVYPNVDSTITIRQLLNHTSGLYNFVDNPDFWNTVFIEPDRVWTPEEIILSFNQESVFPKGTDWHYSQTGYNLLRVTIQNISGAAISDVNLYRFWFPLGLTHTFTFTGGGLPENIAHGWYDLNEDGDYEDLSGWSRTAFASGIAGEVFTTAEDLAEWARFLFIDRILLRPQTFDRMMTLHSPCTGEEHLAVGYGLGVAKLNPDILNGLEAYGHTGNAPGYAAACLYFPAYDFCLGFMDNTEEGNAMRTINDLLTIITEHLERK